MSRVGLARCASAIFVLVLVLCTVARGQQPADATLTIRFANDQTEFRVGEIIPIELSFSTTAKKTYLWWRWGGPQYANCSSEEYHVSPPGKDPLSRLKAGVPEAFLCAGSHPGPRYLDSRPHAVSAALNDGVTLRRPGRYSFYVTSLRVIRREGSSYGQVELRSNTLHFQLLVPTPLWEAQQLGSASKVLDDPASKPEERHSALRTLRFLDSPGALAQLSRQLTLPVPLDQQECFDGLMGSAHPRVVLRDLEGRFAAPDAAITPTFLSALADAEFLRSHGPMPACPAAGAKEHAEWRRETGRRYEQLRQIENRLHARAAALVPSKQGLAQAETVRTLVLESGASPPRSAAAKLPGTTLASAFVRLPASQQWDMLLNHWDRADVPEMSRALKHVLDEASTGWQGLRNLALGRLYDLDPENGAAEILAEIRHPHVAYYGATVSAKTLGFLPDKTLPQFDSLLAERLANKDSRTTDLDAGLIGRYATKAILPQVKAVYLQAPGKWSCPAEDGLLVYFLRTDPGFAVAHAGLSTILCTSHAFRLLAKMGLWSKVQPRIVAKLGNSDAFVASQAATVLSEYGDAKAERALWARLRSFHRQWAAKAADFSYNPEPPRPVQGAAMLQAQIVQAIAQAQNWLLDNAQWNDLERLTLGPEQETVAAWRWTSPIYVHLTFFGLEFHADIGYIYHTTDLSLLCAKLAQFPPGTSIQVTGSGPPDQLARIIRTVEQAAERDGLIVQGDTGK